MRKLIIVVFFGLQISANSNYIFSQMLNDTLLKKASLPENIFFLTHGHRWSVYVFSNEGWPILGCQYFLKNNLSVELGHLSLFYLIPVGLHLGINYYPVREKNLITPFFNSSFRTSLPYLGTFLQINNFFNSDWNVGLFVNPKKMRLYFFGRVGYGISYIKWADKWENGFYKNLKFGIGFMF